jgi:polyhydroxybutyrate depolymerase
VVRDRDWPISTRRPKGSLRAASTATITVILGLAGTAQAADAASEPAPAGGSFVPGCVPALTAGSHTVTLDVDGTPREVIVHIPDVDVSVRLPAVVAFHGYSSFAMDLEAVSGLSERADGGGFVVAYPQALGDPTEWHFAGNRGYDRRDLAMTQSLIGMLVEQACVDPTRVFLAGHSMGGGMASDAACQLAEDVTGVVLVAALWFELPCQPARPVPVIAMHALDDEVLPYSGGKIPGAPAGVPEQLAVEMAIAAWAMHDGCAATPAVVATDDGGAVMTWSGCTTPVVLHRLASGGHGWPAVASDTIARMATSG